jgi:hypothetical protein
MNPRDRTHFDLPGLDAELETLWINLKEDEHKTVQFQRNVMMATKLNSVAIILICVSLLILFGVLTFAMRKEIGTDAGA